MKLELELPESTIKKIKAWSLLSDYGGSADEALVFMIDKALVDEIRRCLDLPSQGFIRKDPQVPERNSHDLRGQYSNEKKLRQESEVFVRPDSLIEQDTSFELGDSDDRGGDGGLEDEEAFVPRQGGLNESDLDRDMMVEDPEHEAISSGGGYEDFNSSAEDLFASQLNLPKVPVAVDPGVLRRERLRKSTQNKRRARVTNYSGGV